MNPTVRTPEGKSLPCLPEWHLVCNANRACAWAPNDEGWGAHGGAASASGGGAQPRSIGVSCVISRCVPKKRAKYNESCNAWSAATMRRSNA
eukprot:1886272-Pleurochrysis_carterae.AAC.3